MKKFFKLALMVGAIVLASCSKKDDENVEQVPASIDGTWILEGRTFNGQSLELEDCEKKNSYLFVAAVNNYTYTGYTAESSGTCVPVLELGTYTLSGGNMVLKPAKGEEQSFTVVLKDNKLTLTIKAQGDEGEVTIVQTFVKK